MNSWNIMKVQTKSIKVTRYSTCESRGHGTYMGANNHSELNNLVVCDVSKELKIRKNSKGNPKYDSELDAGYKHFWFKKLYICEYSSVEWYHVHWEWLTTGQFFMEGNLVQKYFHSLSKIINPTKNDKLLITHQYCGLKWMLYLVSPSLIQSVFH